MTRIVAGMAGGRRIVVPPGRGTRPTSDRAREGLFSTLLALRGSLAGARVLDLYAGSGAVGLEALSRGAGAALLVEADARAARTAADNARTLGLAGATIRTDRVARVLAGGADRPYDVVFADPPYATADAEVTAVLHALVAGGWLAADAVVAVERSSRAAAPAWPAGLAPERSRRYGEATLWYGRATAARSSARPSARSSARSSRELLVRRCVCPGSFDPATNGHLDVIGRASRLYDEVVVAVLVNQGKSGLFPVEERMELLRETTAQFGNVTVDSWRGLLVDFCRDRDIPAIVKGLRAVSDFDYELQMAQMNHRLSGVETVFVATNPEYSFLSSSLVKEVAAWGGDVSGLVPDVVGRRLAERLPSS